MCPAMLQNTDELKVKHETGDGLTLSTTFLNIDDLHNTVLHSILLHNVND